jgi:uncharacterized membrane-anchored protein
MTTDKKETMDWLIALEDDMERMLSDDEAEHWDIHDPECWKGLARAVKEVKEYVKQT